jgi:hypothetical protein
MNQNNLSSTKCEPALPVFCRDPDVQAFVEEHLRDFNPYRVHLTPWQIFDAAFERFGTARCLFLSILLT